MRRSTRHYWPRAESKLYEEPKKLVAHGLASSTREHTGRRPRTVYEITDQGRLELKRWLADSGAPPIVEFEGLVKVLFAEQGTKSQLLNTIQSIRCAAQATREAHAKLAAELATGGGPFPERVHVNALVFKFMWEHNEMLARWASWAEDEVRRWPKDISRPPGPEASQPLRDAASTLLREQLEQLQAGSSIADAGNQA
jgi:DNA-binding PadR family transcriptional regulator